MQFERITLQEFVPGVMVTSEAKSVRTFIPQYKGKNTTQESEEPPPPPPPPTYSEEQLQAAREEGYRNGFNDGEKKGLSTAESEMAMVDKHIRDLMQPLAQQLLLLFTHYDQFLLQQKQTTPLLAGAIAKKIAGAALQENPMANIEAASIQCIERMLGEAEVHIYVHPTLSDALEDRLIKHFAHSHEPGNVLIHKDEALEPVACRIEWKHGGLNYDPSTVMEQMDQLVNGIAGAAQHMHEAVTAENIADQVTLAPAPILTEPTSATASDTEPLEPLNIDAIADSIINELSAEPPAEAPSTDIPPENHQDKPKE